MSEAIIEKINIQINTEGKKASKGLESLIASLKKLQNYANNLGGVSAKLQSLANSVKSLSGIKLTNISSVSKSVSRLSEMVKEFNAIGNINASKAESISKVFESFTDVPSNRITSYLKGIRQLPQMVSEINNMPEIDKSKIQSVTEALSTFSSIGDSKTSGMMRTLKQLPDIAQKINSMDMDECTAWMDSLSSAVSSDLASVFIKTLLDGFKNITKEGTALGKILGEIKSFQGVGLGSALSFFSAKDLFYDLTAGTLDWKNALFDTLGIAEGIGLAFAAGGPIGGAVAIVAAIAGAIWGWQEAEAELWAEQGRNKFLWGGEGKVRLDDLTDAFSNYADEIVNRKQAFIDMGGDIDTAGEKVKESQKKVEDLMTKFSLANVQITQKDVEDIKGAIKDLAESSKEQLGTVMSGAIDTVKENFATLGESAKGTQSEILSAFYLVGSQGNTMIADAQANADKLAGELAKMEKGTGEYNDTYQKFTQEIEKISNLSFNSNTAIEDFNILMEDLKAGGINIANQEELEESLSKMTTKYKESVSAIDSAYEAQVKALNQFRKQNQELNKMGKGEDDNYFKQALENAKNAAIEEKEDLKRSVEEIGTTLGEKIDTAGMEQWFCTLGDDAADLLAYYKGNIQETFNDMTDSDAWQRVTEEATGTVQSAFDDMGISLSYKFGQMPKDFKDRLCEAQNLLDLKTGGSEFSKNIAEGLSEQWEKEGGKITKIPKDISTKLKNEWDNLPEYDKQLWVSIGWDYDLGELNTLLSDASLSVNERIRKHSSLYQETSKHFGSIGTYATGGYPTTGEMFIAREAGPEMVGRIGSRTAVANNDQITSAIAQAVESAIIRAGGMFPQRQTAASGDTYVFIDSEEVASRMERRSVSRNKRTNGRG